MKRSLFLLLVAVAITLPACEWIFGKKTKETTPSFIGKWQVDSLAGKGSWVYAALLISKSGNDKDSSKFILDFKADSTVNVFVGKDSILAKYDFNLDSASITIVADNTEKFSYSLSQRFSPSPSAGRLNRAIPPATSINPCHSYGKAIINHLNIQ